ncbi:MAG TPA: sortase [Candidatus Saccharimonadales bacterium]
MSVIYTQDYYLRRGISFGPGVVLKTNTAPTNSITGHPEEIDIPSVSISVPVIDGIYNSKSGAWTLTLSDAQYLNTTPPPNNKGGKTFIYGHYRPAVFAYLHHIQPGAVATIKTTNGYSFNYTFINTYDTKPYDLSVLNQTVKPTLTLQTCSGFEFQNRQMYNFNFTSVTKV